MGRPKATQTLESEVRGQNPESRVSPPSRADILDQMTLLWELPCGLQDIYPPPCYPPLDANSTHSPPALTTKNVSNIAKCPLGAKSSRIEDHCPRGKTITKMSHQVSQSAKDARPWKAQWRNPCFSTIPCRSRQNTYRRSFHTQSTSTAFQINRHLSIPLQGIVTDARNP